MMVDHYNHCVMMTNITTEQPWEDGRVNRTTVLVDDRESRS